MSALKSTGRARAVTTMMVLVVIGVLVATFRHPLVGWFTGTSSSASSGATTVSTSVTNDAIDHYTCSMHPSVNQPGPGKCPICGMKLIPVHKDQEERGIVTVDDARRQLIGVRTGPVIEGPMRSTFRAVGRIAYDETALADVSLKVRGWITKLYVNETGQRVTRGQTLFTVYSPELYNAEQDFLLATRDTSNVPPAVGGARVGGLKNATRERLRLLGVDDKQIDELAKRGTPAESLPFASPANGFVIEKNVVEGAAVDPGMRLYRIAALNKVWVEADIYEEDFAKVRVGDRAVVTLDYLPGRSYEAKVAYVYPYLDDKTRTGRARVELANKGLDLRPGMLANVTLSKD
ncbi:MAG: efflux RND transporter periplasmic adaptor subunit, partial [Polyangiaceae bacterium]